VLAKLPPIVDERALVGSGTVDDAGVYLIRDDTALVVTLDFFTPVVDNPRDYGRIAAANALSDIYAMGGAPLVALNIMCFPDGELPSSVMAEILLGGNEKVVEAGALVLGGHSVSDRELKYGLAAIGIIDPARVVTNSGARVGDVIVLTKPIGVGVMATALKEGELSDDRVAAITELMATLNGAASEAMLEAGAHGATDVTGFGLVGHAREMAEASGVTLDITVADVPLIEGALETISKGLAPGGLFSNQHYYSSFVELRADAGARTVELMFDPQTSGGLLVSLDPGDADAFLAALSERGGEGHVVGRAVERGSHDIVLS
jgi:selenide,water dikinase